jgi:hypothetical protein
MPEIKKKCISFMLEFEKCIFFGLNFQERKNTFSQLTQKKSERRTKFVLLLTKKKF